MASVVTLTPQGGGWSDSDIASGAKIAATKLIARRSHDSELFGESTTITALNKWLHIARAAGTLIGVEAAVAVAASGDRTVTVDIEKSSGGGAFASIMSTTINIDSSTAVRTPVAGTISDTAIADDDIFRAVVTVAGSTGSQAQGLTLTLTFDEEPA